MFDTLKGTTETVLVTAVADSGTVAVAYPTGTVQADFTGVNALAEGSVALGDNDVYLEADGDVVLAYGGSTITVTNDTGITWPAGTKLLVGAIGLRPARLRGLDARVDDLDTRVAVLEAI